MSAVPQWPQLTLAVGITGHKPDKLADEAAQRAERHLVEVFSAIDAACLARHTQDRRLYVETTPHRVRLFSCFAEGADRIAVKARPRSWDVTAVLPFPRRRYEEDVISRGETGEITSDRRLEFAAALSEATVVVELEETHDAPPAAYARAGGLMLRQIDILVAVWDGAPATKKGGTADIVAHALDAGIPVVWIASNREQAPWIIAHVSDATREVPLADASKGPIAEAVDAALAISPMAAERLEDFLVEPSRSECIWTAYDALTKLPRFWEWRRYLAIDGLPEIRKHWQGFLDEAPEGGGFRTQIEDLLLSRFAAADAQATYFVNAYRSAYVLCYVLAVLAIAFSLIGVLPIGPQEEHAEAALVFKAILVSCEFVLIAAIISLVHFGHKGRWHERWLDYRALAEMLRHLRFLAPVGESANHQFPRHASERGSEWVLWYLRATIRELGCPNALLDASYQRQVLRATEHAEIDGQIAWHGDNSRRLTHLHHQLLHIGDYCFAATAALLFLFMLGFVGWLGLRFGIEWVTGVQTPRFLERAKCVRQILHGAKPFLIVLAALLPAIGAAVSGIRFTGDFEGYADRSTQTASELDDLKSGYEREIERLELDKTATILIETARVMSEDIDGWQSLYTRKRLALPA
ncbi:hypothetical protein SAMN05444161_4876 [Rhizobiales bacterium GAS191]|nr:hypothetical protein SAMN05444161_4876 [Rhizobiales bacterium GAS191]